MSPHTWTVPESVNRRVAELSLIDKIALALHDFAAVSAEDVVPFEYADGPNGVRGHAGATAFPAMLALAASFDRSLAAEYGAALAREILAAGKNVVFSPGLDIVRVPWGGRAGQQLSEDPFLAGEIGGIVGRAVQGEGVLAIATHYVANNFEWRRTGAGSPPRRGPAIDVQISARALHEIYLSPFRRALTAYGVGGIMGSYNRLNGEYVCHSADLLQLPRTQWDWPGVIVPDAVFAVRDPRAALAAGLDLPALGDDGGRTEADLRAAGTGKIDEIVTHVLAAAEHVGLERPRESSPEPPVGSAELARRIATDGMVLLTNRDETLPLPRSARVALIDAVGVRNVLVMGGAVSVTLTDDRIQSVSDALRERLTDTGGEVIELTVGHGEQPLPPITASATADGISATLRDGSTGQEQQIVLRQFELATPEDMSSDWSATVTASLRAEVSGPHTLTAEFAGRLTIFVDDVLITSGFREASPMIAGPPYPLHAVLDLEQNQTVDLRVEYETSVAIEVPPMGVAPHLGLGLATPDDQLSRAVELAAQCDAAVVICGRLAGEAMDVDSLRLPGRQEAIATAICAANPRTTLVTLGAGPVVLPARDRFGAMLHAWYPGEQFAPALADVLTGRTEPGGRLPITFPADEQSTPIQDLAQYPGDGDTVQYSEELLVGYRWYDATNVAPAFAFGHGLGYTTFAIEQPVIHHDHAGVSVSFTLRNDGARTGKATPQVFVGFPDHTGEPPAQLKGFDAVTLESGEDRKLIITILKEDLMIFDGAADRWTLPTGTFEFSVALSSRDVRAVLTVDVH